MNFSNVSSLLTAAKELTMGEKGIASAKVILTGFVVVFSMLLLLILIIKIYSTIVSNAQSGGKKKKADVTKVKETKPASVPAKAVATAPIVQDGLSEEVVAVISAAVATMYGSPEKAKIKSIKKSNGGRSAWANAGVLDNTRPF